MPFCAVYVTHSSEVALKELDEIDGRRVALNTGNETGDTEDWTCEKTTDRFVQVIENIFWRKGEIRHDPDSKVAQCDELLILVNQDLYPAISNMVEHAEIHGYAKKCRAVPSLVARLNFVTSIAASALQKLEEGDFFSVTSLHQDGYELFRLKIVSNHNYQLCDWSSCKSVEDCAAAFQQFHVNGLIKDAFFLGPNSGQFIELGRVHFIYGQFIGYNSFEEMLYQGGFEKLKACYRGSGEVLDFAPLVMVRYLGKEEQEASVRLFEPSAFSAGIHPSGRIKGFRISYAPELIYVNKFVHKFSAKGLMSPQMCPFVEISAQVHKHGILALHANVFDEGVFEYRDPANDGFPMNTAGKYDKFATRFASKVFPRQEPVYVFDGFNKDLESEDQCLVYTLRRIAKRDMFSLKVCSKGEDTDCDGLDEMLAVPMFMDFLDGKIFDGDLESKVVTFKERHVFHDVSRVIGLKWTEVDVKANWLVSNNGNPCYTCVDWKRKRRYLSPEYVLAVMLRVLKKNTATAWSLFFNRFHTCDRRTNRVLK